MWKSGRARVEERVTILQQTEAGRMSLAGYASAAMLGLLMAFVALCERGLL